MQNNGYGTKLRCPISNTLSHSTAYAFVDDVDLIQTETSACSGEHGDQSRAQEELLAKTQEALNQWSLTLHATGGALEPSKTFYVPMITEWKGCHKGIRNLQQGNKLTLEGSDGGMVELPQQDPNDSFFTLGVWQSPSGNDNKQKDFLCSKIREWGLCTNLHRLSHTQAQLAVRATISRTLAYPLMVTAFNEEQCAELQKTFLQEILGKIGVVCTTPPLISTALTQFGG
jgi:hypothetical protein